MARIRKPTISKKQRHGGQVLPRGQVTHRAGPNLSAVARQIVALSNVTPGGKINRGFLENVLQREAGRTRKSYAEVFRKVAKELHKAGYKVPGFSTRKKANGEV